MKPGTVCVGILDPGQWSASFGLSLSRLYLADSCGKQRIIPHGKQLRLWCGAGGLVQSRNKIAAAFLDDTDCEWLFWVDSDMGFDADIVDRLVEFADLADRPVMGALCFGLRHTGHDERFSERAVIVPTLYRFVETDTEAGFQSVIDYERDALVEVAGTGSAAILIHRTVLELIRSRVGDHWYDPIPHPKGATFSEDLSFCIRAASVDLPIWVHTGVQTAHDKGGIFLDQDTFDRQGAS